MEQDFYTAQRKADYHYALDYLEACAARREGAAKQRDMYLKMADKYAQEEAELATEWRAALETFEAVKAKVRKQALV